MSTNGKFYKHNYRIRPLSKLKEYFSKHHLDFDTLWCKIQHLATLTILSGYKTILHQSHAILGSTRYLRIPCFILVHQAVMNCMGLIY